MPNKLIIKSTECDEAWLDGGEVAVPIEITVRDGEALIEYYPSAKDIVCEFVRLYGENEDTLFSREAISFATEKFGAFLTQRGFELSPDSGDYYINFALPSCDTAAPPNVCRIDGTQELDDLTDTDVDGLVSGGYIIYAAVVDKKIVSLANTGEPIGEDTPRAVEIGVDTAEDYRRRGLGKACVLSLVSELSRLGHTAIYECASGNTASIRLAESLGGTVVYKKYYAVGFLDE